MIRYACPVCGAELSADDARAGGEDACPQCRTRFLIPGLPEATPIPPRDRDRDRDSRDDRPKRREPEKVRAIGGMLLGGGIYALVHAVLAAGGSGFLCCLWPGVYFGLVWGILAVVRGSAILNGTDTNPAPRTLHICQIITIVNFDVVNLVLGIMGLVFLGEPEVQDYFDRPPVRDRDSLR